jgi:DNA-binding NarL/FixJ family response regulator/tetratricopeptide (TPR) repeat protein
VQDSDPLVGRDAELARLQAALDALVAQRRSGLVALDGEPGIGKTRLLAELVERAGAAGCLVLAARPSLAESDVPFSVWEAALTPALEELGTRGIARLGLEDGPALALVTPAVGDVHRDDPQADGPRVAAALRDGLSRLARARPLVVCLDDVHVADSASTATRAALVHRPAPGGVLLAFASRPGRRPQILASAVQQALADERLEHLTPGPLTREQARALGASDEVYARAGGNPFYLRQLVTFAGADVTPTRGIPGIPAPVIASLAAELSGLSPAALLLLRAGSLLGDPFDVDLAAAVAPIAPSDMHDALDELAGTGLLRTTSRARTFAFRHPLVRDAVEAAPPGSRLAVHERAARELEARHAPPLRLARHIEHAATVGDEHAIGVLRAAAVQARPLAPATAARFLAAAAALTPDAERERELRVAQADATAAAGDPEAARDILLAASAGLDGDASLTASAQIANAEAWLGRFEDARARLRDAIAGAPAEPSRGRLALLLSLGLLGAFTADFEQAAGHARDAGACARALGDRSAHAAALALEALARAMGGLPGALSVRDQALAAFAALDADTRATRLPAFWMLARATVAAGDPRAALALAAEGRTEAEGTGRTSVALWIAIEEIAILRRLGRLADAIALGERTVERAGEAGLARSVRWALAELACTRMDRGDIDGAARDAARAESVHAPASYLGIDRAAWTAARALGAGGHPRDGVERALRALGSRRLDAVPPASRAELAAELVELQVAAGDLPGARSATHAAVRAHDKLGSAELARALVLLAEDDPECVVAAEVAVAAARDAGGLAHARARLLEGRARARFGERSKAIAVLVEAHAELDQIGAMRDRDLAVRELRRLGHRVRRAAPPRPDSLLAGLSTREEELARLVASGLTNREVAERLVLSVKTVETHLRNVYAKLGVSSRVELATLVGATDTQADRR